MIRKKFISFQALSIALKKQGSGIMKHKEVDVYVYKVIKKSFLFFSFQINSLFL